MSLGLNASLYMGARSLSNQQIGVEVSGHNISNINTPNAARQRVIIREDMAISMAGGEQGTGSIITGLESLRSRLLDDQVVRQASLTGYYDLRSQLLSFVQDATGENFATAQSGATQGVQSTTGIQNSLNSFFDAWQSLADDPSSSIARNDVLAKTNVLISDIKSTYNRMLDLRQGLFSQTSETATQVNTLAQQIADLNSEIAKVEVASDFKANDLRDQRQECIEQLSKLVNVTITPHTAGSDSMLDIAMTDAAGAVLVNGTYGGGAGSGADASVRLDVVALNPVTGNVDTGNAYDRAHNSAMRIVYTNASSAPTFTPGNAIPAGSTSVTPTEGELGALVDTSNNKIGFGNQPPDTGEVLDTPSGSVIYQLNTFATQLISLVNTAHTTNTWDQNGNAGTAFFTAGGNAKNISLSATITGPELIAAAQGATFPGELNGASARAIVDLRENTNLGGAYQTTISNLGMDVQQAQRYQKSQQLIQDQITKQRDSVSGISLDEEMTNLMNFQRAFEASARFINVIDEMMQRVVNLSQ